MEFALRHVSQIAGQTRITRTTRISFEVSEVAQVAKLAEAESRAETMTARYLDYRKAREILRAIVRRNAQRCIRRNKNVSVPVKGTSGIARFAISLGLSSDNSGFRSHR